MAAPLGLLVGQAFFDNLAANVSCTHKENAMSVRGNSDRLNNFQSEFSARALEEEHRIDYFTPTLPRSWNNSLNLILAWAGQPSRTG
jgi:hypothetical protein